MKQIFLETSDWFKDKLNLANQNGRIRKSKRKIEKNYKDLVEEMSELNSKYTNLLEQKSEQFDLYLHYKKQCEELTKEKREMKKEIALLNEKVKILENKNGKRTTKKTK